MENPDLIAIAGDWHGNTTYMRKVLWRLKEAGATVVVQVGDLGYWGQDTGFMRALEDEAARLGMVIYFVDGNHEHHRLLLSQPLNEEGLRVLSPHVIHLPRGHRWRWGNSTWMALGGATSVDRPQRREGYTWFPEEALTAADMALALRPGTVDVMVTHDAPLTSHLDTFLAGKDHHWEGYDLEQAHKHHRLMEEVVRAKRPRFLYHGHFHESYRDRFEGETLVVGLDRDGTPLSRHAVLVTPDGQPLP